MGWKYQKSEIHTPFILRSFYFQIFGGLCNFKILGTFIFSNFEHFLFCGLCPKILGWHVSRFIIFRHKRAVTYRATFWSESNWSKWVFDFVPSSGGNFDTQMLNSAPRMSTLSPKAPFCQHSIYKSPAVITKIHLLYRTNQLRESMAWAGATFPQRSMSK